MIEKYGLYDIYGITHIPWWQTKTCYIIASSIVLLSVLGIGIMLYHRYRQRQKVATPYWHIALEKLAACKSEAHHISAESSKELYSTLTSILKYYLQDRFGYDLQGKTDNEILIYLASVQFPADLQEHLCTIFKSGTEIKFAYGCAMREQFEHHVSLGIDIIKRTMQQPPSES